MEFGKSHSMFNVSTLTNKKRLFCFVEQKNLFLSVAAKGLEPSLPFGNLILNQARLPIPPRRRMSGPDFNPKRQQGKGKVAFKRQINFSSARHAFSHYLGFFTNLANRRFHRRRE